MGGGNSHHAAVAALITRFKEIRGTPDYWHDLEGRVYNTLIVPEDEDAPLPFVDVVTIDDRPEFRDLDTNEGKLILSVWRVRVFGFITGTNLPDATVDTDAQELLYKLQDDLLKAILKDYKLGGTVDNCSPIGGPRTAGVLGSMGELTMEVELQVRMDHADLGPA